MDDNMDGNMDDNIALWTITELQLSQSQSTLISRRPITGLPTARPITEYLNFAITGSGEWSAEILFIFDENVTLPEEKIISDEKIVMCLVQKLTKMYFLTVFFLCKL